MTACAYASNVAPTVSIPVSAPETNPPQTKTPPGAEKIMADFFELTGNPETDLLNVVSYISGNILYLGQEDASKMLLEYERLQQDNLSMLTQVFNSEEISESFFKEVKDGSVPKPHEVKDEALKVFLTELKICGYKLEPVEGMYDLKIDYSFYAPYSSYATPEIQDYFKIMISESSEVFAKDAGLLISWEEVVNRALSTEAFLKAYPDSSKKDAVRYLYNRYEYIAFNGLDNTPLYDYKTGQLSESAKSAYENALKENSGSEFLEKLESFMELLKKSGFKYKNNEEINTFRGNFKIA